MVFEYSALCLHCLSPRGFGYYLVVLIGKRLPST